MGYENMMPFNFPYAFEVSGIPYQGIYEVSTIQKYMIGARYHEPWSARSFRYAKAAEDMIQNFGAQNTKHVAYEGTPDQTYVAGNKVIVMNAGSYPDPAPSFTKDELMGAFIHMFSAAQQARWIVGNKPTATNTEITLDYGLESGITADTTFCEIHYNPWGYVGQTNDENRPVVGMPMCAVTAAEYCWLQTWGPRWLNPYQAGVGGAGASEKQLIFVGNACAGDHHINVTTKGYQHAGFVLDNTADYESTFVMLQISP